MIKCVEYDGRKKEWDNFVDQSKTPLFFFKRDYMEYHANRFLDCSLMFFKDDVLVGIFPSSKHDNNIVSHGGLTYGGLIFSNKTRSEVVIDLVICLAQYLKSIGCLKIIYKAIPFIFYTSGSQEDLYAIYNVLHAKIFRRDLSSVIYLDNPITLSKGRKWMIARAKKAGLQVTPSFAWAEFHELLSKVLEAHHAVPVHSVNELIYLTSKFPDNIQLKAIEHDGHILAATLLFKFKTVVHTQYLAVSEQGRELGALDLLIKECIEQAKNESYKYFNFGVSTEEQGTILNSGLIAQKEGFGARGMVVDFYEVQLS